MAKARKFQVIKHFQGPPKLSDFKIVEQELPPLKDGEILVKTEFISVDPYLYFLNGGVRMSLNADDVLPYDQESYNVGIVQDTKNPKFPIGTRVVSHTGWNDYYIRNPNATDTQDTIFVYEKSIRKMPNLKGLPVSLAVGTVGMPGVTAYLAFLPTNPKPGETVVVSGAAGAVGTIVGQIAKIKGCKVIGFAGSDEKVQWLEKELGFDKALNYKTVDAFTTLQKVAPQGVDIYYDNVGGEISSSVIRNMNKGGRVVVGGSISCYTDAELPKVTVTQPFILVKQLQITGFTANNYSYDHWERAFKELVNWIKSGQIKAPEHITEGFENTPKAFIGVYTGENFGKAVVKV